MSINLRSTVVRISSGNLSFRACPKKYSACVLSIRRIFADRFCPQGRLPNQIPISLASTNSANDPLRRVIPVDRHDSRDQLIDDPATEIHTCVSRWPVFRPAKPSIAFSHLTLRQIYLVGSGQRRIIRSFVRRFDATIH